MSSEILYNAVAMACARTVLRLVGLLVVLAGNVSGAADEAPSPDEQLLVACELSDVEAERVDALIAAGADVNARTSGGSAPLHLSAANGADAQVLSRLLAAGADPHARDSMNMTPLLHAAGGHADSEAIRILVESGADVHARCGVGGSVLQYATQHGTSPDVVAALIDVGADVNTRDREGWTPLMFSITRADALPEVSGLLLVAGADVDAVALDGWTPLHLAVRHGSGERLVTELLESGADDTARLEIAENGAVRSWTPLMLAARWCSDPQVHRLLLGHGSGLEHRTNGHTPLSMAVAHNDNPQVAVELIRAGAKIDVRDREGMTPLATAVFRSEHADLLVPVLVEAGADVNISTRGRWTPLLLAARWDASSNVVGALLAGGARCGARIMLEHDGRNHSWSPLLMAARWSTDPAVVKMLLVEDGDVDRRSKRSGGLTALLAASSRNPRTEVASVFLQAGADIEAKDSLGRTPLIAAAAENSNPRIVALLMDSGANLMARDDADQLAIDHASRNAAVRNDDLFWRLRDATIAAGGSPAVASDAVETGKESPPAAHGQFFGISTAARRVAYIVDMSGSMVALWPQAREELLRSISGLPQSSSCYIVLYSDVFAVPDGQKSWMNLAGLDMDMLKRWLFELSPHGGTNPLPAFEHVFALRKKPDVIFFLTDGLIDPMTPAQVASLNGRNQRAVVNTVAFRNDTSRALLEEIARDSGGVYRHIRRSDLGQP